MPSKLDILRGATRPVVTLLVTISACILALVSYLNTGDIPDWFISAFASVTAFWFASRGKDNPKER